MLAKDFYLQAELFLLHSMLIGGPSFKAFVNLVSFACMRNDFKLAKYYLKKAKEIDPSSSNLQLLSNQISKQQQESNEPFSFNELKFNA